MLRRLLICFFVVFITACTHHQESQFTGQDEYIVTVPMPPDQSGVVFSNAIKVLPGSDWDLAPQVRRNISQLQRRYNLKIINEWPLEILDEFCVVVRASVEDIEKLRADPRIVDVQRLNHFVTLQTRFPYNDPRLRLQLGNRAPSLEKLHRWSTGKNVKVGIIDSPVDISHPDLRLNVHSQQLFVPGDLSPLDYEHGTAVAGIITATPGNGIGIVGFAPDVELRSYAACRHDERWGQTVCNTFSLAKALNRAGIEGVQVVNLSIAGPEDRLIGKLINDLIDRKVIVVASDNPQNETMRFPASIPRVIGASVLADRRLVIPRLVKTEDEHLTTKTGGDYQFYYGSSMSTARVTALVSILLEKNPFLTEKQARTLLLNAANCSQPADGDHCLMGFALGANPLQISSY